MKFVIFIIASLFVLPLFLNLSDYLYYFLDDLKVLLLCFCIWYWIPIKGNLHIKNISASLLTLSLFVLLSNAVYWTYGDMYPVWPVVSSSAICFYLVYRSNKQYLYGKPVILRSGRLYYLFNVNPRSRLEVLLFFVTKFSSVKFVYDGKVYGFSRAENKFIVKDYEGRKVGTLFEGGHNPTQSQIDYLNSKLGQEWSVSKSCFTAYLVLRFKKWV